MRRARNAMGEQRTFIEALYSRGSPWISGEALASVASNTQDHFNKRKIRYSVNSKLHQLNCR
jgi:hypothetical protein